MENATKALLIAAGIFFGILIVSISIFAFNQISEYYTSKEKNKNVEQLATFNKQYVSYNREDVRGSDLITLVNKIIDFNTSKEPEEATMEISIIIPRNTESEIFYYSDRPQLIKFNFSYTESNIKSTFLQPAEQINAKYPKGMAEKLASRISTLMDSDESKQRLLKELNITYEVDNTDILKYYEYQQFKRAHFNSEGVNYTSDGRVKSFKFTFNGKFE